MSEHFYKNMTSEEQEELLTNFLITSWSYSKVGSFSSNEKAFEMQYIYNIYGKRSSSSVAGVAYHIAMDLFFRRLQSGTANELTIDDLERVCFEHIDEYPANYWKLQKTTPTIEECRKKAFKTVNSLLKNFMAEKSIYENMIEEVIHVEERYDEFLTINGVDIPLPCHAIVDLVVKTKEGKIAIIDHKTKSVFTDEQEAKLSIGKQAIIYALCFEARFGKTVDEVYFVENKISQNKDNSPQLVSFKVDLNEDNRRLYECLLYEPLKRMLEATSDPNYVFIMNDRDNMTDKAELHEFWARTMTSEVADFSLVQERRKDIAKRTKKIRDAATPAISVNIIKRFRESAAEFIQYDLNTKDMTPKEKIQHVLRSFSVVTNVAHVLEGYSCDTYLLEVSAGVKIDSIKKYKLDIANALNLPNVRIGNELVVYDGRSYLPVEAAKERDKFLLYEEKFLQGKRIPLGVDNYGNTIVWDLMNQSTPHALICGATGSGKSVCIINTLEFAKLAGIDDILILDPKFEFVKYSKGATVLNDIKEIEKAMEEEVKTMQERVRTGTSKLKLIIFDEFADALASSSKGKELDIKKMVQVGHYALKKGQLFPTPKMQLQTVGKRNSLEENLKMLLQKGRSAGYRIVAATQRASVQVITGDAKVNFPVQICFRVPKEVDSKVVLDEAGAETLSGKGDGLIKSPEYLGMVRFQAFFKP